MVEGQRWRGRAANLALIRRAHMAQIKTLASDTRARGASPGRIPVGRSHQYSVGLSSGTCRWMQVRKRGGEGQQAVPKKPALWALEVQRNPGWLHNSRPIHRKRTCGRPIAREALTIGAITGWASVGCGSFQQTRSQITAGPREEPKARSVQGSHEKRPRTAAGHYCASGER